MKEALKHGSMINKGKSIVCINDGWMKHYCIRPWYIEENLLHASMIDQGKFKWYEGSTKAYIPDKSSKIYRICQR